MLPSHLCSHSSLYSTKDQLFARGIIAKKKKMKMLLIFLGEGGLFCFLNVRFVLLGFKVYTSKSLVSMCSIDVR